LVTITIERKKRPKRASIYLELSFRFKRFAVCFFRIACLIAAVVAHDINRGRVAFIFICPIFAGINFAKHIFCHCYIHLLYFIGWGKKASFYTWLGMKMEKSMKIRIHLSPDYLHILKVETLLSRR
jgi:hypothetical protein